MLFFIPPVIIVIAAIFWWWFNVRTEKFMMKLYRPTYTTSIPATTWDPADILTAVMPQGIDKHPKLAVESGNYRRFQRV